MTQKKRNTVEDRRFLNADEWKIKGAKVLCCLLYKKTLEIIVSSGERTSDEMPYYLDLTVHPEDPSPWSCPNDPTFFERRTCKHIEAAKRFLKERTYILDYLGLTASRRRKLLK